MHPSTRTEKTPVAPSLAPAGVFRDDVERWKITDHCCRVCFSRVLERETFDRRKVFKCAGCGAEAEGKTAAVLCACGMKLKTGVDMGLRCLINPDRSPEMPAQIVAALAEVQKH